MQACKALAFAFLVTLSLGAARVARGQTATIDSTLHSPPGGSRSTLGDAPGSGGQPLGFSPGAGEQILGGRPGVSTPRVPTSISTPGGGMGDRGQGTISSPLNLAPSTAPILGSLAIPELIDEGPADGLTLDMAIERLVRDNLDLRSKFMEIPQAEADVLTASLRANPIFYADSQLIPYSQYSSQRPGGQTQYDVNISYPLDITGKRKARTLSARRAKKVLEAQFQDAVRLEIDNLYTAFVDLLAAKGAVKFSEKGVAGLTQALEANKTLKVRGDKSAADVGRVRIQYESARIGLVSNQEAYRRAKRTMGVLLAMTPEEAEAIEPRGTLRDLQMAIPSNEELVRTALTSRPDLHAFRLGLSRAEADVQLARANRLNDVYVLVQPYTFQDNTPQGLKSSTSYAVGLTVPLPLYNRNQGNIQRARLNVTQTQIEVEATQRKILYEVRQAEQDLRLSLSAVEQLESNVNPEASRVLLSNERLFLAGEANVTVLDFINARSQYNDVARLYLDSLVRYRRAMLVLNTAVGQRVLP